MELGLARARTVCRILVLTALVLTTALAAGVPRSAGRPALPPAVSPIPVVVDTDLSTDDILALLYLLRRPDVDVRAVIVSGTGLVHGPAGARNALALLALAGRTDVPVAIGRARPLAGDNEFPAEWRARADAFFGLELPPATRPPELGRALELIRTVIAGSRAPVTLLSLAPLTDNVELLRAEPALKTRVAAIYAMGGAVGVPGNIGPGHPNVEFNLWIDPVAAQEVVASGVPLTLVPLVATNQVPVTVFLWSALKRYHYATPEATAAWDLMSSAGLFYGGQYFWDPLAATALTSPGVLRFARKQIRVIAAAGPEQGRTFEGAGGTEVRVAVDADRSAFERDLVGTLVGGGPFELPAVAAGATLTYDGRSCSYRGPTRAETGLGRLSRGKTIADLRAHALARGGALPAWFQAEATGETPPRSAMIWLVNLSSGNKALVAKVAAPGKTWIVAGVTVTGRR